MREIIDTVCEKTIGILMFIVTAYAVVGLLILTWVLTLGFIEVAKGF